MVCMRPRPSLTFMFLFAVRSDDAARPFVVLSDDAAGARLMSRLIGHHPRALPLEGEHACDGALHDANVTNVTAAAAARCALQLATHGAAVVELVRASPLESLLSTREAAIGGGGPDDGP